jgi:rare lipoprotein A
MMAIAKVRFGLLPILLLLIVPASVWSIEGHRAAAGRASWYGKALHGKRTASGERFDMHALTAAHRTLPFGTIVRVTDVRSRKSVNVRINDRGPFHRDRIIDLSYEAARKIGIIRRGTARVEVKELDRG